MECVYAPTGQGSMRFCLFATDLLDIDVICFSFPLVYERLSTEKGDYFRACFSGPCGKSAASQVDRKHVSNEQGCEQLVNEKLESRRALVFVQRGSSKGTE